MLCSSDQEFKFSFNYNLCSWQAKGLSINVDDYKFNGEHLAKELCFFHFIRFIEDEIKLYSVAT